MSNNYFKATKIQLSFVNMAAANINLQETEVGQAAAGVARRIDFDGIAEDETIRVFLRVKPVSTDNINDEINTKHYKIKDGLLTSITSKGNTEILNEYFFNGVLSPISTQEEIFDIIVRPRLEEVLMGSDTLLFAYGTTGSGKSFTIQGKGSKPGIIPRVLYTIFASISDSLDHNNNLCPLYTNEVSLLSKKEVNKLKNEKNYMLDCSYNIQLQVASKLSNDININDTIRATSCTDMEETLQNVEQLFVEKDNYYYSVWISFIEIYNENIYDLFVKPELKVPLKFAFDMDKKVYVKDMKYMCISSWEEAYQLYLYGKHNLHVSPTGLNEKSSRSHSVFTIKIIKCSGQEDISYDSVSSFSICDLAGAERQKKTGNYGERLKESQNINTSLLVLNRCFNVIRANQSKKGSDVQMVPFRESKLTLLFQNALLGQAGITMITNISQSNELSLETKQVLKCTAVAMKIKAKSFAKSTFPKRESIFSNYCLNRKGAAITGETAGNEKCRNCARIQDYKKEIEVLKQKLEDQEKTLFEGRETFRKREVEIRSELVDNFTKMLQESDTFNEEKMEKLKERERERMLETKLYYQDYYKRIYAEKCKKISKPFEDSKIREKVLELSELHKIDSTAEEDTLVVLDKIIEIQKNTAQILDTSFLENQPEADNLKEKIKEVGNLFCTESLESVDVEDVLNRIMDSGTKMEAKILELESTLSRGATEYTELENHARTLEIKINQLEEEIAVKDHKQEDMASDVKTLNALLAEQAKMNPIREVPDIVVDFEKLNIQGGSDSDVRSRRRTKAKSHFRSKSGNSDSESEDPSFFLPIRAATTAKKKKKKNMPIKLDVPSFSYSKESFASNETLNNPRSRRKLFRHEADTLGEEEPIEIPVPSVFQQSPESFMRSLRPRKK